MTKVIQIDGTEVTRIGLGTNRLTHNRENVEFLRAAVDAGLRHIDTAHIYTGGSSEETIGAALSPVPDGVLVATKGGYKGGRATRAEISSQIEDSLRRLRTERIGLYYLHRVDRGTAIEESVGAIADYRERGAIANVGLSAVSIEQIERARKIVPIAAVQNHYNLSKRSSDDVLDYCEANGIAFVPYFPLGGRGGRALRAIAKAHEATKQQVTLAWLLRRSPAMLPIPGTLSLDHLKENLAALDLELSDDEFEDLS